MRKEKVLLKFIMVVACTLFLVGCGRKETGAGTDGTATLNGGTKTSIGSEEITGAKEGTGSEEITGEGNETDLSNGSDSKESQDGNTTNDAASANSSADSEATGATDNASSLTASVGEKTEEEKEIDRTWEYNVDISWIDPEKPMVALSFDDGPVSPVNDTSSAIRIQNAIADNGMHATFFYWGISVNDYTKTEIQRAYDLGFEIANHTKSHPYLTNLSEEEMIKEVEYMDKILSEISGQEKFLVRPPYLSVNDKVKETLDVPLVGCGLDSQDWAGASAQDIIDTIVRAAENGTLDGKVVLMHETYGTTAEAVEYLVPYLKELGYQVVSVSEMYCARGKTMKAGKLYNSCSK